MTTLYSIGVDVVGFKLPIQFPFNKPDTAKPLCSFNADKQRGHVALPI